jgi:hypothetical protein
VLHKSSDLLPELVKTADSLLSSFTPLSLLDEVHLSDSKANSVDMLINFFKDQLLNARGDLKSEAWVNIARVLLHLALARGKVNTVLYVVEQIIERSKLMQMNGIKDFNMDFSSVIISFSSVGDVDTGDSLSLYWCGSNDFGELCIPVIQKEATAVISMDNSVAETENADDDGDKGNNNLASTPMVLPFISYDFGRGDISSFVVEDDITSFHAGLNYTLLLTSKGQVYSCGRNGKGQCGHGTFDSIDTPLKSIGAFRETQILQVAVNHSGSSTCFLSSEGIYVYT